MTPRSRPTPDDRPRRPSTAARPGIAAALLALAPVVAAGRPLPFPPAPAAVDGATRLGADPMPGPGSPSLIVAYYEALLADRDVEGFKAQIASRFTEGTLARLLRSGDVQARRAAALALGLVGTYAVNTELALGLKDDDPGVRELATQSLWSIWFRAGTPEQNAQLRAVADRIGLGRYEEADALATRLIRKAPDFAEAYNQRAIARFSTGRFADSAADCRRALERNPYHVGALSGLGQCYRRLGDRAAALETFRRALELQPHDLGLRQTVSMLESGGP